MRILFALFCAVFLLTGCASGQKTQKEPALMNITPQEAKGLMDTRDNYVILDVRTPDEFAQGHIPDAVLLPDYEVANGAAQLLPEKDQLILVYCRSGRRSKNAARELEQMGYTQIREFGGILDWPYELEETP